jgi:hypothetical protein
MSGKVPFFLTGGNARIYVNGKLIAFATDVNYRVSVKHASPRLLGKFEVEEHQPLAYDVSGSMTLIRYARGIKDFWGSAAPDKVSQDGDGIGSMGQSGGTLGIKKALGLPNGAGRFDGNADENMNPGRMYQAKSFDIEIRQVLPRNSPRDRSTNNELAPDLVNVHANETQIVLLRGCRISDMGFTLSRKGAATQQFAFLAQYADDDTMIAATSGVGQELS